MVQKAPETKPANRHQINLTNNEKDEHFVILYNRETGIEAIEKLISFTRDPRMEGFDLDAVLHGISILSLHLAGEKLGVKLTKENH